MWSWAKSLKLKRRASLHAVLLAVAGAFVVPAGAAEPPEAAPEIWCELFGIERAAADYGVDYQISNLQSMRLIIWVDKGNLRLPEFSIGHRQERPDPAEAVTVERQGNGAEAVEFLLNYRGPSIRIDKFRRSYVLTIPLSEEKIRERFESWKQKLLEISEPEGKTRIEKAFGNPKSFKQFRRDAEHRTGVYRISCKYSSAESGFWDGEVRSEIIVEIYFEKTSVEKFLELHE